VASNNHLTNSNYLDFFAAGPINTYARQVIDARGTTFKPDWEFIRLFPYSGQRDFLRDIKPRAAGTISPDRNAAYALLRRAWEANRNRQFAAASESYQQALLLAPGSATLHLAYAANLLLSQNYAGAETQARQSLRLWPENAEGHGVLALALIGQKQFPEAESESRETLRIFPDHRSAQGGYSGSAKRSLGIAADSGTQKIPGHRLVRDRRRR
jgi:tetratricopeptide (TPR) repeat protein